MRYNQVGINIDTVDKLIMDIYNYADRISKTLNQISDIANQTKNNYDTGSGTDYRNKFNNFTANFPIIKNNIISYAEDLIKLKNKYQKVDEQLTQTIKRSISKSNY